MKTGGVIHDRDRNAAINLKNFAAGQCGDTPEFQAVTACGQEGADVGPAAAVKPAAVKQEPNQETFVGQNTQQSPDTFLWPGRSDRGRREAVAPATGSA